MANKCPKCGYKLKFYYLKQNCPQCDCDLLYYNMEQQLEQDAKKAEEEFEALDKLLKKIKPGKKAENKE